MKLTFGNITMDLNVVNTPKQQMEFDDREPVSDLEETSMSHVFESFCKKCESEYGTITFDEQCDDLLLAFFSFFPSTSHEIGSSVSSSLCLEMEPSSTISNMFHWVLMSLLT